jgi:hypothetical protein
VVEQDFENGLTVTNGTVFAADKVWSASSMSIIRFASSGDPVANFTSRLLVSERGCV